MINVMNMLPADQLKNIRELYNKYTAKKCVIFGAGGTGKRLFDIFYFMGINVDYFIDNDCNKTNKSLGGY